MLKNIKISVHCTQRHPLEGGGRQTVNTRSTFGEALKYFGYNGTNELCGRSMTSKLSVHEPNGLFHCYKDIDQKVHFYGQTLSNWDFCLGESHEILFLHYSRPKSGEGGITWSVCTYMNFNQIKHGQDFSEIAFTLVKVKVKVVSIGLSPTIKFVWQYRCSNIGHKRPKLLKKLRLASLSGRHELGVVWSTCI